MRPCKNKLEYEDSYWGQLQTASYSCSASGAVTPDYRYRASRGLPLPHLEYDRYVASTLDPIGSVPLSWFDCDNVKQGNMSVAKVGNPLPYQDYLDYPSEMAFVEQRALRSFFENIKSSDLQSLVALGEMPKTMNLIANSARRMAGFLRGIKRLDPSEAFKSLGLETGRHARNVSRRANTLKKRGASSRDIGDFAADTWLEVKYGWKPLLYDIESAAEALAHDWANEPRDVRVFGSGNVAIDHRHALHLPLRGVASGSGSAKVRYQADFQVLDPTLRNANSLGLTNLATVAWELIPYSFVFDWFVPVGAFLDAQTAYYGLNFRSGSRSQFFESKGEATVTGYLTCNNFDVSRKVTYLKFERRLLTAAPSSMGLLSPNQVSKLFNFDKVTTSLALLNRFR